VVHASEGSQEEGGADRLGWMKMRRCLVGVLWWLWWICCCCCCCRSVCLMVCVYTVPQPLPPSHVHCFLSIATLSEMRNSCVPLLPARWRHRTSNLRRCLRLLEKFTLGAALNESTPSCCSDPQPLRCRPRSLQRAAIYGCSPGSAGEETLDEVQTRKHLKRQYLTI
jgi:hypothetical protein